MNEFLSLLVGGKSEYIHSYIYRHFGTKVREKEKLHAFSIPSSQEDVTRIGPAAALEPREGCEYF